MKSVNLNGIWQLTYGPQVNGGAASPDQLAAFDWETIPATVPGNVELDMVAAGKLEDPVRGNRIYALRESETYQWWYRRSFATPSTAGGEVVELVFDGLDCLGTIWLNGQMIGTTDNMLIPHRFDVTELIRSSGQENELVVRIDSAVLAGRAAAHEAIEYAPNEGNWEALHIRKAPHMYGWDIMPRAVSAGLWRDVRLEILPPTRLRSMYWATLDTAPNARTATVRFDWDITSDRLSIDGMTVKATLSRGGKTAAALTCPVFSMQGRHVFRVQDADFWWPRGYGEAALYDATVEVLDVDGTVLDSQSCRLGLRTIKLDRTDITTPEDPGRFVFVVNGVSVFAKGTNWVPLDAFHSRDTQHLPEALAMTAELNCNMIRCWGGNVYEPQSFFDFCDENGIMIWQDFAMGCAYYPQTDEFAEKIRVEAVSVVKSLRNHPSLALWAGNNENDTCMGPGVGDRDPNEDRISRQVLPEVIRRLDEFREYLPSSPYISPELVRRGRNRALRPEEHLWRRADYKDPFYTESPAHFVSEIGYHGCPDRQTMEDMLDPECLWPWQDNDQWLTKSVRTFPTSKGHTYRIQLMADKVAAIFGTVPDDLDDYILASQIAQAEAFKFFIEWWHQDKGYRSGILWWNVRDGWPILSDAIVDYYNRKKLAYEYVKRVQTDVAALIAEPVCDVHALKVVNDTLTPASGRVRVTDADTGAEIASAEFAVPENGIVSIAEIPAIAENRMWLIDLELDDGRHFPNHYLTGKVPVELTDYKRWLKAMEK